MTPQTPARCLSERDGMRCGSPAGHRSLHRCRCGLYRWDDEGPAHREGLDTLVDAAFGPV